MYPIPAFGSARRRFTPYGVLLAAAYMLRAEAGDGPRECAEASTRRGVMDLGIYIIISALVEVRKALSSSPTSRPMRATPPS